MCRFVLAPLVRLGQMGRSGGVRRWWVRSAWVGLVVLLHAGAALAADKFEIQVYEGARNPPGRIGLELHSNNTWAGRSQAAYAGETPPQGAQRFTLEPSLGVNNWLEVGGYLQGMVSGDAGAQFGGWKLRTKWIVPREVMAKYVHSSLILGLNVEVSHLTKAVEESAWGSELRPILGLVYGRFGFFFNPILDTALVGPDKLKPEFEPAGKVRVNTNRGFGLGVEYYAGLGRLDQGILPRRQQDHLLFAVFDLQPPVGADPGPWSLNVAVGRALTAITDQQWMVKTIVGRSF